MRSGHGNGRKDRQLFSDGKSGGFAPAAGTELLHAAKSLLVRWNLIRGACVCIFLFFTHLLPLVKELTITVIWRLTAQTENVWAS